MLKSDFCSFILTLELGTSQVVEFISVLLTVGSEAAEKELIRLGAVQRILDLFFK